MSDVARERLNSNEDNEDNEDKEDKVRTAMVLVWRTTRVFEA